MLERWKRYAKMIECDCCSDRFHDRDDHDDDLVIVIEAAWTDHGFTTETAPPPSRDYLPTRCDACMHFSTDYK